MFTGAHIAASKTASRNQQKETADVQVDDKIAQDLANLGVIVPRTKPSIAVENRSEKHQRKVLAQERRQERLVEQRKMIVHMEGLMEKIIDETPISRKDAEDLREKVNKILTKVNNASETPRLTSIHPSVSEDIPSASSSQLKLNVSSHFKSQNNPF
ncbi:unnamed protein product [Adineta ricciae]|uniref:Uncharacterized protein n=1 Tax=Adineta ricciae TaxID=249248 RepID=A0A813UR88_ADIRI|nr:unnamed protein product [Adineta ricciae]